MSDPKKKSYNQTFREILDKHAPKSSTPLSVEEWRNVTYWFKVLDVIWFDEDPPDALDKEFTFYWNDRWPNPVDHPIELLNLAKLDLPDLIHLSRRIKKPAWVNAAHAGKFTLEQYMAVWRSAIARADRKS